MRPVAGVAIEIAVLAAFLALSPLVPSGIFMALFVISAELLATYLIHCPAHYLVGAAVGIRFRSISLGRTTLARVLPPAMAGLARLIPLPTLSTDKTSLARVQRRWAASMYASGTVASASSAILIAAAATPQEPLPFAALSWAVAVGYLLFDIIFSPRTGDIMRARAFLRP